MNLKNNSTQERWLHYLDQGHTNILVILIKQCGDKLSVAVTIINKYIGQVKIFIIYLENYIL